MSGPYPRIAARPRRMAPSPRLTPSWRSDKYILLTLFVFLFFEVFQGPLRYYLSHMGGVLLAYAPKGLMLITFVAVMIRTLLTSFLNRTVLTVALTFLVFGMVGAYFTKSVDQPLLGIFSLMPMLFGIVAEPAFSRFSDRIPPFVLALWLFAAVGVAFNYFHSVPWAGFTYQLGDTEVEVSRDWTYFGVERIAGFARASFEAATQLLFMGMICAVQLRQRSLALVVWIATGVLIAITTTKTTLGLYLFLTILLLLVVPRFVHTGFQRALGAALPFVLVLVGVLLPISTLFSRAGSNAGMQNSGTLLASFAIRLAQMWPDTFSMIFGHGSVLLGRGLGGIGAAQKVFEPYLYSPADNLYLYLYATFGVFALVIIWTIARAIGRLKFAGSRMTTVFWLLGISILMEGWTVSCIEGGTMAVATGLTVAFSLRSGGSAPVCCPVDGRTYPVGTTRSSCV